MLTCKILFVWGQKGIISIWSVLPEGGRLHQAVLEALDCSRQLCPRWSLLQPPPLTQMRRRAEAGMIHIEAESANLFLWAAGMGFGGKLAEDAARPGAARLMSITIFQYRPPRFKLQAPSQPLRSSAYYTLHWILEFLPIFAHSNHSIWLSHL